MNASPDKVSGVGLRAVSHTAPSRRVGRKTHLAVQLDVLGKQSVDLSERAAQAAQVHVQEVLDGVHLVVLHKMLPILELPSCSSCDPSMGDAPLSASLMPLPHCGLERPCRQQAGS